MKRIQFLILFSLLSSIPFGYSQCAMCKAVVENGDSGLAEGLNDGIVTLMVIPYILVAIIAFILWRNYQKNK
ncbi:hypothetical protein [Wenyingzhuangia sp. 2_MG-2023]|uniref:hypothetical protein n=1 Tax=Wenyingzhuangia sp. 2_MG-2023 TaxID=3062639 RepID=UPI0026E3AF88|nr:hypothetical protein [Wenyingzhuangia sp. 2_MG-2023]MDO6736238.1 hypothetical protein [Wenyingzhuangia sp. 2_MG-2023]MDO6801458.1 hypothetical protein [Wenyingzhuangia sp. 1_MG-2023]